jgi:hypothetical protein
VSLDLSLYRLDQDLATLYDMRQQAEDAIVELSDPVIADAYQIEGKSLQDWKSEATALDAAIAEYMAALPKKVDTVADYLWALELAAGSERMDRKQERGEIDQEIARLKWRRDEIRARYSRIVDAVKFVLETGQWKPGQPKKLEGTRHSLSLRGNGGKQPVEVDDESLVPDEFVNITVRLTLAQWTRLLNLAGNGVEPALVADARVIDREPSLSAIGDALAKPCGACEGKGVEWKIPNAVPCKACGGSGKNSVAGCRLKPRGDSLVVK